MSDHPRRFSLAPISEVFDKKREDILAKPIKLGKFEENRPAYTEITQSPNWNSEFQQAVDEVNAITLNQSVDKRIAAYSKLGQLYQNFIDTATMYGKIIISERYLPEHCRTFKPCNIGGIAGGEKFVVQNILFKICTDHVGVFGGNDYYAHKLASHELKGLTHIFNYGSKLGLYVPMMCVLVYKGFHMIAMSLLPVDNATLVYGSPDAGRTIHDDSNFTNKLKCVADELGLKQHKVGKEGNIKQLYTPVDMEGHIGTDGRMYVLDFSRLFPPERPSASGPSYMYLCRLLRPEFVKLYASTFGPLSPDAYSTFSDDETDKSEINNATEYLLSEHLPLFLERFSRYNALDPFAWTGLVHSHGINYRHLGSLRKLVLRSPQVPNYTSCDTATLILMAMISRVVKNALSSIMRAQVNAHTQNVPGDQLLKQVAATFLNVVFGNSKQSQHYWNTTMKDKLGECFPHGLTDAEFADPHFGEIITKTDLICWLFNYTIQLCGLRLRSSAVDMFKTREAFAFASPIDEYDIEEIRARVKSMSVAAFAEGYIMQTKAMRASNDTEAKRLYRLALEKLKKAIEMEPGNIQALTLIFSNMVETGFPKVAESIYHSVVYQKLYDADFLWRYANFCKSRGLFERAEVHYLHSLELNPNYALSLSDYAKFLCDTGDVEMACKFFHRAVLIAPQSVSILRDYATFAYRNLGDSRLANEIFERAVSSPDFGTSDYALLKEYAQFLQEYYPDKDNGKIQYYLDLYTSKHSKFLVGYYSPVHVKRSPLLKNKNANPELQFFYVEPLET